MSVEVTVDRAKEVSEDEQIGRKHGQFESSHEQYDKSHRKGRQRFSNIWSKFTIVNYRDNIAACHICGCKMSYRTTISNLKKHLIRKHKYDIDLNTATPFNKQTKRVVPSSSKRSLTELGGLDGLILNVVGEEGDNPAETEEGVNQEVETVEESRVFDPDGELHNYCIVTDEVNPEQTGDDTTKIQYVLCGEKQKTPQKTKSVPKAPPSYRDKSDQAKRSRILDLQLECLEIKKYNMTMEAMLLENQLNLPRSMFTQVLRDPDTMTRSTQTDVGGNNTKVFYVSDNKTFNESSRHFFTFQASVDD